MKLFVGMVVAACLLLTGCAMFGPTQPKAASTAPGASWEKEQVIEHPDGTKETNRTHSSATGPATKGKGVEKLQPGSAQATETGASTKGGGFLGMKVSGVVKLYGLAALLIVAGLVLGRFFGWKLGLMVGGTGVLVIFIARLLEAYPWVVWTPVAVGVGIVVYVLYRVRHGETLAEVYSRTATSVVKAVAGLKKTAPEAYQVVKDAMSETTKNDDGTVVDTVDEIKKTI